MVRLASALLLLSPLLSAAAVDESGVFQMHRFIREKSINHLMCPTLAQMGFLRMAVVRSGDVVTIGGGNGTYDKTNNMIKGVDWEGHPVNITTEVDATKGQMFYYVADLGLGVVCGFDVRLDAGSLLGVAAKGTAQVTESGVAKVGPLDKARSDGTKCPVQDTNTAFVSFKDGSDVTVVLGQMFGVATKSEAQFRDQSSLKVDKASGAITYTSIPNPGKKCVYGGSVADGSVMGVKAKASAPAPAQRYLR